MLLLNKHATLQRCSKHWQRCSKHWRLQCFSSTSQPQPEHPGIKVQTYLRDLGLKPFQNARILGEMEKKGMLEDEQTFLWIKQRVSDLSQVMGTADPCPSLFNLLLYQGGLELLEQDAALMPQRLVALKEMLPGTDIVRIVSCVPRLLYNSYAVASVQNAVNKLVAIYPYQSNDTRGEVLKLVQEYPELLVRIPLYCQDQIKTVEDLPVDLQNRILRSYC